MRCYDSFARLWCRISRINNLSWCILLLLVHPQVIDGRGADNSSSVFIERCRMDCHLQRDFATCGKYKVARWLQDFKNTELRHGAFRLIRIPSITHQPILPKLPQLSVFKPSMIENFNFVRAIIEDLLTKRAIVYTVDNNNIGARSMFNGPLILDEDELKDIKKRSLDERILFKKKKSIILPILILLNLVKLKLILLPIFLGVHFIKKMLIMGSFVLPSILAHLKVCKVQPPQTYPYHAWATAAEAPVDYPTGYGYEEPGPAWAHRNDIGHPAYSPYQGHRNPYG